MKEIKLRGHSGKDEEAGSPHHPEEEKWQPFLFLLNVIVAPICYLALRMCQERAKFVWLAETPISPQHLASSSSLETESLNLSWVHSGP